MGRFYAEGTTVAVEKSKTEIEALLKCYKADQFMSGWDSDGRAFVMFRLSQRYVKFLLRIPPITDPHFLKVPSSRRAARRDQRERELWRSLLLVIKAKLESVEAGIETVEEAFLAQTVLPDGSTVGAWAAKALPAAYETAQMPKSLLALPPAPEPTGDDHR